jgi:putative Holliday junction resolvase
MALDVGDKTIGVALSDELGITANGLTTIERVGIKRDTSVVMDLVKEHNCSHIVVGLPLNLDGSDSIQTMKVREFYDKLTNKLRSQGLANVELSYYDERFTTKIAENILIQGDVSREKRKTVIDKQAAVVILQGYLESTRQN